MTQKTNSNPWTMDVRVRERNLKSGALTDKDLEKHLAALPDLADQAEPFAVGQPALAQQAVVHASPVSSASSVDDDDMDDEDDEDEEEVDAAPEAAPAVADETPPAGGDGEGA